MTGALLDAAFRMVSHSLNARTQRPLPTFKRSFQMRRRRRSKKRWRKLDAGQMAEAARGPANDNSDPPLNAQTLAVQCPGFSGETYFWAINDGYTLTR